MSSDRDPLAVDHLLAAFDFAQASAAAETAHKRELESLLLAFIDVIDSLQTLETHYGNLAGTTTARIPVKGVGIIVKQALQAIAQAGVIPMNCSGQPLDLMFHEVQEVRAERDVPADTILEEVQRGYIWRNKLLRRAKVIIAGGPDAGERGDGQS